MNSTIFIQIDYEGRTFYLSNGAVTKEHVYYPYLYAVPQIGIGGEGFAKVTTGQVSIIRVDDDLYHPFSGERYYSLISKPQEIPFRMYFENEEAPIFVGNLTLSEVTEDELRFMVVEETFEKDLVYPVLDREGRIEIANFYLFAPEGEDNAANWQILVSTAVGGMPAAQTEVILERTYSHAAMKNELDPFLKLDYEEYRNNRFMIGAGSYRNKRVMFVETEDQSQFITVSYLLNYIRDAQTSQSAKVYLDVGQILTAMGFTNPTKTVDSDGNETWSIDDSPLNNSYSGRSKPDNDGNTIVLYSYEEMMINTKDNDELYLIPTQPETTYYLGQPVNNPFSFGEITLRDPVVPFGDRKIKRNYANYSANANNYDYHPDSAVATIIRSSDLEIYAADAGQSYIKDKPSELTTDYRKTALETISGSGFQVYDKTSNSWQNWGAGRVFNKFRFSLSSTTSAGFSGVYYGNSSSSQPTSNNAKWEVSSFSTSSDVTAAAVWVAAGNVNSTWYRAEKHGTGTYWKYVAGMNDVTEDKYSRTSSPSYYWMRWKDWSGQESYRVVWADSHVKEVNLTAGAWNTSEVVGSDGHTYKRIGTRKHGVHYNNKSEYDATNTYWQTKVRNSSVAVSDVWTHGWNFSQVVSGGPKFWRKWKPFAIPASSTWQYRIYDNGVQIESFTSTSDNVTTSPNGHRRGTEIGRITVFLTTFYYYKDLAENYQDYNYTEYQSIVQWQGSKIYDSGWVKSSYDTSLGVSVKHNWKHGLEADTFTRGNLQSGDKYQVKFRILNKDEYYTIQQVKQVPASTGTVSFVRSGSQKNSWANQNPNSWNLATSLVEGGRTYTVTKGAEVTGDASGNNRYWKVNVSYTTPAGYVQSGTHTALFAYYASRLNSATSSGGYIEMYTPNSNDYMILSGNSAPSLSITGYHNKRYDSWSTPVVGRPRIQATEKYTYELARERIYKRSVAEENGVTNGKGYRSGAKIDSAFGVGWSKGRSMINGEGDYALSQVYIENGVVYESTEYTSIGLGSSPDFIDGTYNNLPQHLRLTSVNQAALMATHGLSSDLYRLYRNDNNFEDPKPLAVIRYPMSGVVDEPTTTTYVEDSVTYYSNTIICHSLGLNYDADPFSVYLVLECYVGSVIHNIEFRDGSDTVISVASGTYPDGIAENRVKSYSQCPVPSGTQKIIFTVQNDEADMDAYSKLMRGFDLYIYQRFFPAMNATSSQEKQYAIVFCLEFFNLMRSNGNHWQSRYVASHFMDLFHSSGGSTWEFISDEVNVYAIRNPSLKVGNLNEFYPVTFQQKWSPRVFDNGVELGIQLDPNEEPPSRVYISNSDELFIHLSHNPFGQIAITGSSVNGLNLIDFYNFAARKFKEEKDLEESKGEVAPISFSLDVDFSMTDPDLTDGVMSKNLPIYQDGDITIFEMVEKVAKATNQQFFFRYTVDDDLIIQRQVVVVDLNYMFSYSATHRHVNQNEIVSFSIEFPYPIKAFESTLSRNHAYKATFSENFESIMKRIDTTYRVAGTGVGNVQNYEVFAESFNEGRYWLNRFSETETQPRSRLEYNGIDRSVSIGKKVGFTDEFRQIQGFLIVQEVQYNFENESTIVSGISKFEEIIYS